MKNVNVYVFCLLAFFMFRCPADDQLIAAWDFTQGTIHSTDNMVIPMYLRGSTRLVSSPEGSAGGCHEDKSVIRFFLQLDFFVYDLHGNGHFLIGT